jgi:putative inorganic carbon (hco3(-)) transporter
MNLSDKGILEKAKTWGLYIICILYILLNAYFVRRDVYYTLLIPVGLILLYIYIYRLDVVILMITFCTPIAINLTDTDFGIGISVPTEPLMFGVLILFIIKSVYDRSLDPRIIRHPVSVLIILSLVWIFLTSLTSQLPMVSFKFLVARLWFVIPFYFLAIPMFRKPVNARLFLWLYTIPLLGVIVYTTINHSHWGFEEQAGHWVMYPFYNDHTAYGAILTMYIPIFAGFSLSRIYSGTVRVICFLILGVLLMALVLSFSRAAWMSLAVAIAVLVIILLRIRMKWIVLTLIIFTGLFFLFQNDIWDKLEKNKQGTSENFVEHVQSISNISTDASNLERINRWQSAFRMFHDRPVFGFGPGTYQFEYGPYQQSMEKTKISTDFGDRGNAHSEYIGPLAETGLPGILIMISIMVMTLVTGLRVYHHADSRETKVISLSVTIGLITYFVHGTMNNFLDSDKASVPFWGFIAILVMMDLYHLKREPEKEEERNPVVPG